MTTAMMWFVGLTLVTWLLSLLPRVLQEGVIFVTALIGLFTLALPAVYAMSMIFGVDIIPDKLVDNIFPLLGVGVGSMCISGLFYQGMMNKK